MISLEADKVAKNYGLRRILKGVSFTVTGGTSLVVVGPNGSGKSTLLRVLSGLAKPTSGRVTLRGEFGQAHGSTLARRVSYTSPYVGLYKHLTFAENLELVLRLQNGSNIGESVEELAATVDLAGSLHRAVSDYSTGMVQRAKIAIALANRGSALILDEPFANLDEHGVDIVKRVVAKFVGQKQPVVVATNISAFVSEFDDALVLDG